MKNNFKKSLTQGKKAEEIVYQLLTQNKEAIITDVSEDKEYQKMDVDFTSSTHGKLEVKSDNTIVKFRNLAFEISNERISGTKDGWFNYCQADLVFFLDLSQKHIFIISFLENKEAIEKLATHKRYYNKIDNCYSNLLLLNIDKAIDNNLIDYIYTYDENLELEEINIYNKAS